MSAQKILTALTADVGLTVLVIDRVELAPARQGLTMPYIAFEFEGDDPIKDLLGVVNKTRQDWSIFAMAETYAKAEEVGRAIISAMNNHSAEFRASFQSSSVEFDKDNDTYRYETQFKIIY